LSFKANHGQANSHVKFLSRGRGYSLFLTPTEAVLVMSNASAISNQPPAKIEAAERPRVRMKFLDANRSPEVTGLDELPGKVNYFIGNDSKKWRTNIPSYAKVKYNQVYPGVDLVFYGNQRQLEFDFVIAPGFHSRTIKLSFEGVEKLKLDNQGNLMLHIAGEQVRLGKPYIYQEVKNGARLEISGGYVLEGENQVGFQIASHDDRYPLVIDPVLVYSTYLGGSGDDLGAGIAVDAAGNAYVAGWTSSVDFPTTASSFQTTYHGGGSRIFGIPSGDAFVTKIDPEGTLVYSTFIGGRDREFEVVGIAVDASGSAYVTGLTSSADFPTTPGAFQSTFGGIADVFVAKLNPTGSELVYSTYLGGREFEFAPGLALDGGGNAYVTGITTSSDFATTRGAFQTIYSGSQDAFVTKLNPTGSALVYSSYLGGSGLDEGRDVVLDSLGNAYVTGVTSSTNFPTTMSAFQAFLRGETDVFVSKLNATGSKLVYSTYLGGTGVDISRRLLVDASGNAYITGSTTSLDFPLTPDAFQITIGGGEDAFVTILNPVGSRIHYSTFLGGSGNDRARGMALDTSENIYITGFTNSANFPTAHPIQSNFGGGSGPCFFAGGCDAFIAKIALAKQPRLSGRIAMQRAVSPGRLFLVLQLSNTGSGMARHIAVNRIVFQTLVGKGTVTYKSPQLPIAIGNLDAGGLTFIGFFLNVPSHVKSFTIIENGHFQDHLGKDFSFSVKQNVGQR
jgi:hypothetical protein